MNLRITTLAVSLMLIGCVDAPSTGHKSSGSNTELERPGQSTVLRAAIQADDEEMPLYVKHPLPQEESQASDLLPPAQERTRIRMTIDQVEASLNALTGGVTWMVNNSTSHWTANASKLGVPNYMQTVRETREPTLLFNKIVGDGARDICPALLKKELEAPPQERVFLMEVGPEDTFETAPELVEANLSQLVLKYHGRFFSPGDTRLEPWKTLFSEGVKATDDPVDTWTAVCVALITHPDFTSY